VEPQDVKEYSQVLGGERVLALPKNNGGLVYSRNWIKKHAIAEGHARHWQFDDDITRMMRLYRGKRLPCDSDVAIRVLEDFVDRYENVALASFNSEFFVPLTGMFAKAWPPFYLNARCYTCFLMLNSLPNRWRYRFNEDTDMTLQVLADGWCTILFNAFMIRTKATMTSSGGQTPIYVSDGRLHMARQLERVWPGVVTTKRKFNRPQHHVKGVWKKFDTPLIRRKDIDWDALERAGSNEYGMRLRAVKEVKDPGIRALLDEEEQT